jgi:hypothetical protein
MRCPTDEDLARLDDAALSVEQTERLNTHVSRCFQCREREGLLRALVDDVKAAVPTEIDVRAHVRAVMDRLDSPIPSVQTYGMRRAWQYAGAGAVAACAMVSMAYLREHRTLTGTWQARGGETQPSLGRDVGIQPYAVGANLRSLSSGARIDRNTPLTAGFRNLGTGPAFLLLFAVDARQAVHWISPPYVRANENPVSTRLQPTVGEQMLGTTAVLEDVPLGPLRIVAVVTAEPAHVSDVESLEGSDVGAATVMARLPGAEVRETLVGVASDGAIR